MKKCDLTSRCIVGIIPARGGSKGIPRKNVKQMAGYPLVYWTIEAARQSRLLNDFFVSTEDPEITRAAFKYGAKVLNRPINLAQDDTTTLDVLRHIISKIKCTDILLLQPTSPMRNKGTIDECICEYVSGRYDTLATGFFCKNIEYGTHKNLRRQDIKGFFYDDGNVYIINRDVLAENKWSGGKICRKVLPKILNFEIDDETDWMAVESLLKKRIQDKIQPGEILSGLKNIKMLAMDVDGVLTDRGMYYSEDGEELKKFDTRDAKGIEMLRTIGIRSAIITGEKTGIVKTRADKMKIDYVCQGVQCKTNALEIILKSSGLMLREIAYIGDDLNDLDIMKTAGVSVAVADAVEAIKEAASFTTSTVGGRGAVREVCDMLIKAGAGKPV